MFGCMNMNIYLTLLLDLIFHRSILANGNQLQKE